MADWLRSQWRKCHPISVRTAKVYLPIYIYTPCKINGWKLKIHRKLKKRKLASEASTSTFRFHINFPGCKLMIFSLTLTHWSGPSSFLMNDFFSGTRCNWYARKLRALLHAFDPGTSCPCLRQSRSPKTTMEDFFSWKATIDGWIPANCLSLVVQLPQCLQGDIVIYIHMYSIYIYHRLPVVFAR